MTRIFTEESRAYGNLEFMATYLTMKSHGKVEFYIGECYLDYSAKIMWTTIFGHTATDHEWQILSPVMWQEVVGAESEEAVLAIAREYVKSHKDLF